MTCARHLARVTNTLLWWAPTLAAAIILAALHFIAIRGRLYRIRRAHRLIDRGDAHEAERVIAALRRDQDAVARWRESARL